MRKLLLLIALGFCFQTQSRAVPAYPYPIEMIQSDGSSLTIILKGDEYCGWTETTDGYSIVKNANGVFEYATLDNNGIIIPSGVKVSNVDARTANETAFIAFIPQSAIREKRSTLQREVIQSRMAESAHTPKSAVMGTRKVLCILIGFTDLSFSRAQAEFNNLMNQEGYSANSARGSVRDYYMETSYGQLTLDVTVVGPYTANHSMAYYGADSYDSNGQLVTRYIRARELVAEAIQKANPDVNYADYDSDGDGYVDGIHLIFAGYDQAAGGPSDAIWSHKWQLSNRIRLDNKWIQTYSCSSELRGNSGNTIATIGTACHEFGHVLGAPDFYDVLDDGTDYLGTGRWDLMGNGGWNGFGNAPAHLNPYTKIHTFGWATAKNLPSDNTLVTLHPANSSSDSFYKIPTPTQGEYFLVENRQRLGFDSSLPGSGMLVWHVHKDIESDSRAINITHPQRLYPLCASATQNPDSVPVSYGAINSGGCPFPGTSNRRFLTNTTIPALRSWEGASTGKGIHFITESGNNIAFVVNYQPSGPSTICDQATYTISNLPEGAMVQWNTSLGLSIVSGQGTPSVTVSKRSSTASAHVSAQITLNNTSFTISKTGIKVGTQAPSIGVYDSQGVNALAPPYHTGQTYTIVAYGANMPFMPDNIFQWTITPPPSDDSTPYRYDGKQNAFVANEPGIYKIALRYNNPSECGWSDIVSRDVYFERAWGSFILYPNPASDMVAVELQEEQLEVDGVSVQRTTTASNPGPYKIELWSTSAMIRRYTTDQPVYQISVSGLPAGIYFVRVIKDGETITKRLIKR